MTSQTKKKKLRKIPKVIADELETAICAVEVLGNDWMELLARYRRNRLKRISAWGLSSIGDLVEGLEPIPFEFIHGIELLDRAFRKLHHFRNNGAGDYVAKDVERVINQYRASGSRKAKDEQQKEILKFLLSRDYPNQENQKAIRIVASERYGVSERTVSRAIEKGQFVHKVFSAEEVDYAEAARNPATHYASAFAANSQWKFATSLRHIRLS